MENHLALNRLRREARGRNCQIRSPVCNGDPDTVVLCHLNGAGMAMKSDDRHAAWGCSSCHVWVDSGYANNGYSRSDRDLYHLRGVIRTQEILIAEGKI